jgi:hypothetical protein
MNTRTLILSSSSSNLQIVNDKVALDDHTSLFLNISKLFDKVIPLYMEIDWGDGSNIELYENDMYVIDRKDVNALTYSPIFSKIYNHEYYPSDKALYKNLSAQILVNYANGGKYWNVIPIEIRSYDFFESLLDVKLENIAIVPNYPEKNKYFLKESKNGYLIELQGD